MLLLSSVFSLAPAEAKIMMGEKILIEEASEEIFTIGDEIDIKGGMENEFIGIGRKIAAHTDVEGDFIGIGFNVNFSGNAASDVYLVGSTIDVEGTVKGSLTSFGKNIRINAPVYGNLRASAENITIAANVKGKTILWGKEILISGEFDDIVLYGNNLVFAPGTSIKGNLTYNTPEKMDLSQIDIRGEIKWTRPITEVAKEKTRIDIIKRFYNFFSLLFPAMTMLWLFPNLFKQTSNIAGKKFIQSFMAGLSFIILTVIAMLVVFITIIGAPLGLIIAFFFFSSLYIARIFPAIFVGRMILFKMRERTLKWVIATLIGIFLFTMISFNPTAKIFINVISIPAGFGALFMGRAGLIKRLRKEEIL